ncbi:MAG: outer membrane lipid asymmetry maintenance protein MlaD [Pseudomonadota bacterium]|nr:outer membrane lipid asymmetry maintenance protein MlaD [Pseudomonadota bacterium]
MAAAKRGVAELGTGAVIIMLALGFLGYALINTGRGNTTGLHFTAQFDNIGGITSGSEVRLAGVKVGTVSDVTIDPRTFQAILGLTVRPDLKLPTDTSAVISTGGLLGGQFVTLSPGGAAANLADGGAIRLTQSATNLEDLLGKFIFNVGSLADATQKSLQQKDTAPK